MSRTALLVFCLLLAAGPAWGLRATTHLDALEGTLADRAAALAGATDKTGKKQLRAAEKALARSAVDTTSLADDLKLAKKIAGPVAKAYAADDEVMDLLTAAADAFEREVEDRASVLARARAPLPEAKLTKKADRLLGKAEKAREKARTQTKLKKRLNLLLKAQRQADKAAAVLATALGDPTPTRLVVSPESALLTAPGETVTLRAIVLDQLERPMQAPVSFASTNPDAAMVTVDGVVSGGAIGSAQILASIGDLETAAMIVNARVAEGVILLDDAQVASIPEPVDETAPYGVGFLYTVEFFGEPPLVGDRLVGTGEIPLGGLVVDVVGADPTLVTLEIRPLDELFTELVIDERIDSNPENLEIPTDVLEHYTVEPGEDGAYVFVPRDDVTLPLESEPRRRPRGAVEGTTAEVGPFKCSSTVTAPLGLNAPPTFTIQPNVSVDFQYSVPDGLQRLVASGGATYEASYKPRLQAALQGKVGCKLQLFELKVNAPGPLAFVVGAQVPIGVGFELSGTVTIVEFGFDAVYSDAFSVEVGIDCTSGTCEPVTDAPEPEVPANPTASLRMVLPNPLENFNVALALRGFGYFELEVGFPLWDALQFALVEGRGGAELTANLAPRVTQLENATTASSYKASLFAQVGTGLSLSNALGLLDVNVAAFTVKARLDVANSPKAATPPEGSLAPDGSLAFDGPAQAGDEVVARVILRDPTFFGLDNVEEVRFYRKDGLSTDLKATVAGSAGTPAGNGLVEYTATWTATAFDPGAEFGVMVTTLLPFVELEIESNSLRTLAEGEGESWDLVVTLASQIQPGVGEPLRIVVLDPEGTPTAGIRIEIQGTGGFVDASEGTTGPDGAFETTAHLIPGSSTLTLRITAWDDQNSQLAFESVQASSEAPTSGAVLQSRLDRGGVDDEVRIVNGVGTVPVLVDLPGRHASHVSDVVIDSSGNLRQVEVRDMVATGAAGPGETILSYFEVWFEVLGADLDFDLVAATDTTGDGVFASCELGDAPFYVEAAFFAQSPQPNIPAPPPASLSESGTLPPGLYRVVCLVNALDGAAEASLTLTLGP